MNQSTFFYIFIYKLDLSYIFIGHHEANEILMPVAKPRWSSDKSNLGECPSGKIDESIALVKKTIAYERKNSPDSYWFS